MKRNRLRRHPFIDGFGANLRALQGAGDNSHLPRGSGREPGRPENQESGIAVSEELQTITEKPLTRRYEALFRVARAIAAHQDPKDLFRALAGELHQVVDFDFMGLFLYDEASNRFENPVLELVQGSGLVIPPDFPPEETLTWWVYHNQKPVVIRSREEETRFGRLMEIYKKYGVQAACVLPLTTAHRMFDLGVGPRTELPISTGHGQYCQRYEAWHPTPHGGNEGIVPDLSAQPLLLISAPPAKVLTQLRP